MPSTVATGASAHLRLERARAWLLARAPAREVLVLGPSMDACNELLRRAAGETPARASFGWHRVTLGRLAAELAAQALAERELVPVGRLGAEAAMVRVVHALAEEERLGTYTEVCRGPGFARAATAALEELRLAGFGAGRGGAGLDVLSPELRGLFDAYAEELEKAGLADRARVFALATARVREAAHPLIGLPTLILDVPLASAAERALVAALIDRSDDVFASVPAGDFAALAHLTEAGVGANLVELDAEITASASSVARLQKHIFGSETPPPAALGDDVSVLSAPGESRECVEIARRLVAFAKEGVPFDRMAVLLRSPEEYRPHLVEALGRAGVPAHFARGAVRPDPAGRAFLALLGCAAEGLPARRFAEYLSLGEVPRASEKGGPPEATPAADRWIAPDDELVPAIAAGVLARVFAGADAGAPDGELREPADPESVPVTEGTLRAPRRWEKLLVDAAVIGGLDRWRRRLSGLERALALELTELEDGDEARARRIRRDLADLETLVAYALPLLEELAALPHEASWGEWLDDLSALATRALRSPERVLAVLSELRPMSEVGPVELAEVQLVLSRRLLELAVPPPEKRYGSVYVAPADSARGLDFDVVFVPGLAEKLFPRQISEDPILLDRTREALDCGLPRSEERVLLERLRLRLAVGAARRRLVLSYPRLDLEKSRPRVPSFYALEALRAAEGTLPGFADLAARAEMVTAARVGWPAPARPIDAIDEAEHDLALLEDLLSRDPERSIGTARYLLGANPHLGRALRFRARRWLLRWTPADGLVKPSPDGRAALARHQLRARSYSPTGLQNFAACPYKFLLQAVHRLAPREEPEAIDELNPLQKGSLVHDTQFELFGRLASEKLLPVTSERLARAQALLDDVLDAVSQRYRDELAPAIDRVWNDGVSAIRADMREWLRRASEDESGYVPWLFELSFGLADRRQRDPRSVDAPVPLDCGISLRGSIDLVERHASGSLRATDHKTGRDRVKSGQIVAGGESLQPVLYALAAEKLFPESTVDSGRLYYCTSAGSFGERTVPLDEAARASARRVAESVRAALETPFLPAAPSRGACRFCDYRVVCGPYEEMRTGRKWQEEADLLPLLALRELP